MRKKGSFPQMQKDTGRQRNPYNLMREMSLRYSQGCPRRALDPRPGGEIHHHELVGEGPGLPCRLKRSLLL